jgi:hypothetical protein
VFAISAFFFTLVVLCGRRLLIVARPTLPADLEISASTADVQVLAGVDSDEAWEAALLHQAAILRRRPSSRRALVWPCPAALDSHFSARLRFFRTPSSP